MYLSHFDANAINIGAITGQIVEWEVTSGSDVADEIIEMSQKLGNCLLVMSTYGRSGFGRRASGSVTEKAIYHRQAPLLPVPTRAGRVI